MDHYPGLVEAAAGGKAADDLPMGNTDRQRERDCHCPSNRITATPSPPTTAFVADSRNRDLVGLLFARSTASGPRARSPGRARRRRARGPDAAAHAARTAPAPRTPGRTRPAPATASGPNPVSAFRVRP